VEVESGLRARGDSTTAGGRCCLHRLAQRHVSRSAESHNWRASSDSAQPPTALAARKGIQHGRRTIRW